MTELFRALDDDTRRKILEILGAGDRTAGELAAAFALGKPTISHHLGLLRRAGLVSTRKAGQSVVYHLESTVLQECLGWVMKLVAQSKTLQITHEKRRKSPAKAARPAPARVAVSRRGLVLE